MKRILSFILVLVFAAVSFTGCGEKDKADESEKTDESSPIDLSGYSFIGGEWYRNIESCDEVLYFKDNGRFGYYCAGGGHPVDDSDLFEKFTFNPDTNTIRLVGEQDDENDGKHEIKVVRYDDETLVLDFAGEERIFYRHRDDGGVDEDDT